MGDSEIPTQSQGRALFIGAALGTLCAVWTAIYLVTFKSVSHAASPLCLVAIMLLGAACTNTLISLFIKQKKQRDLRVTMRTVAIIAICTVSGNIAVIAGLKRIDAAVVSTIFQLQIFMIAGLEWLLMKQRITMPTFIGAIVAIIGFLVMNAHGFDQFDGNEQFSGIVYALIAASTFAVMLVVTRHAIEHISIVEVNLYRLWISAIAVLCWPGVMSEIPTLDLKTILLAAGSGIAGLVLGRLTLMNAVRFISATTTKLLTLSTPVFACLLAWAAIGTVPSANDIYGSLIILAGVAIPLGWAQWRERLALKQAQSAHREPDDPTVSPSDSTH